jgi:hypothetical protein
MLFLACKLASYSKPEQYDNIIYFQGIEMIEFVKSPEDTPETEYPVQ